MTDSRIRVPALSRRQRWLRRLGYALAAAAILFIVGSWCLAHRLTAPRHRSIGEPPSDFSFTLESVTLTTEDGLALRGWLAPAEDKERAIVLLHGYTGDRTTMAPRAKFFRRLGYSVLFYDARACGESGGDCISFGYHESADVCAALTFLRERGYRRLACLGVSQGGATILLAAEKLGDVRCVICESTYDDLEHALDRRFRRYLGIPSWPACCLLVPLAERRSGIGLSDVKPVAQIGKLGCPVFVISGDQDNRVYVEDTQALFAAAKEPKKLWLVPGAGHQDLFRQHDYEKNVTAFLEKYMKK